MQSLLYTSFVIQNLLVPISNFIHWFVCCWSPFDPSVHSIYAVHMSIWVHHGFVCSNERKLGYRFPPLSLLLLAIIISWKSLDRPSRHSGHQTLSFQYIFHSRPVLSFLSIHKYVLILRAACCRIRIRVVILGGVLCRGLVCCTWWRRRRRRWRWWMDHLLDGILRPRVECRRKDFIVSAG